MPDINFAASVSVAGGQSFQVVRKIPADAVDFIEATVTSGTTALPVQVQPGPLDRIRCLVVVADVYSPALGYHLEDPVTNPTADFFILDEPHTLLGAGALKFAGSAPTTIYFSNSTSGADAKDFKVRLLVGRKAVGP
ncbi:MAG TPA: hypothetical protein PKE47_10545 [Verrucomicrobiota bacterium]|nr:hypothetical protein [Verrucomicrobiota bacterium]